MTKLKQKCSSISYPCKTKKGNIVCIPKDRKCATGQRSVKGKGKAAFYKDPSFQRNLAIAGVSTGVVAATIAGSAALVKHDLKRSSVDFNSIRQPPNGGKPDEKTLAKYDTFEPGDLIRKNFKSDRLGNRQHYGVYIGRDPKTGDHMMIDTGENWKSRDSVPYVRTWGLTWGSPGFENDSEYEKVPPEEMGLVSGTKPISKEDAVKRAEKMLYQRFQYKGFSSNCEAFARGIVEGKAYSQQGLKTTPLTGFLSEIVTDNVLKLRTKSPSKEHEKAFKIQGEKATKVGTYNFTGITEYARDQYKMTAQQMVEYLAREEVFESRREWESIANPYSGAIEPAYLTNKRQAEKEMAAQKAVEEFKQRGVPINEAWKMVLRRQRGRRGDSLDTTLEEIGLRSPREYELITNQIASQFPSIEKEIKVKLFHNYLMSVFALLSGGIPVERKDAVDPMDALRSLLIKITSKAYTDGLDEIGDIKISDNGLVKFVGRDGSRVLEFKIKDNSVRYKIIHSRKDSVLVDKFREDRARGRRGKDRQCKRGVSCGDACISPKKICSINLNKLATPAEKTLFQKLAGEAKVNQEAAKKKADETITPTESQQPQEDYINNPDTGQEYTIRELKSKAREKEIYNYSLMTKEELQQSLRAADSSGDQQQRIGRTLLKERGPSQKAIRASGLQGRQRKSAADSARTYKNLQMLAKFAQSQPVGWGVAATGAFLLGASLRAYENTKGQYKSRFKENAEEAERIAVTLGRDSKRGDKNKLIRTNKNNITFVVAPHKGDGGSKEMVNYLKKVTQGSQDPGENWLNASQEFIPFNLKESGAKKGGNDIENSVNALTDYMRNFRRKKDQDAVELAAQIYAYGIQTKTSTIESQLQTQYGSLLSQQARAQTDVDNLKSAPDPQSPKYRVQYQKATQKLNDVTGKIRRNRNLYQKYKSSGDRDYANRGKKFNLLTHSRSGQTAKTAMAYLEKMQVPGELSGKDILEQVNVVALGTPHFGFTDPGKYNFRTIISAQDPVSTLPVFGQGSRQQWISSVQGHSFKDYLADDNVRESLREVFGYYDDSYVEQLRKERGRRQRLNSSIVRLDRKKPSCSPKSQICGQRCIPKKWNCNTKKAPKLSVDRKTAVAVAAGGTGGVVFTAAALAAANLGKTIFPPGVKKSELSLASSESVKSLDYDDSKPRIQQGATSFVAFTKDKEGNEYVFKQMEPIFSHQVVSEVLGSDVARKAGIKSTETKLVSSNDNAKISPKLKKKGIGLTVLMSPVQGKTLKQLKSEGKFKEATLSQRGKGLTPSILKTISQHPDLPKIAAFDTYTSNWDRNGGNLFYDQASNRFTAIDQGNAFLNGKIRPEDNLARQTRRSLKNIDIDQLDPKERKALEDYQETLKTLLAQNPPERIKRKYAEYYGIAGLNWQVLQKYAYIQNIDENDRQTRYLTDELDSLLKK